MVTSLRGTIDTGLMLLKVFEKNSNGPTSQQLSELDAEMVRQFGWTFRFGMGSSEHLTDYQYGYIISLTTINENTVTRIREQIDENTSLNETGVSLRAANGIPEEEFARMEQLGKLPHEALQALSGLRDDVKEHK